MTKEEKIIQPVKQVELIDDFTDNTERFKRGKNPKSLSNLTPFPKGVSGNLSGRPSKYVKLAKALKSIGKEKPSLWDLDYPTYKEEVLHTIWKKSTSGSIRHILILAELGCLDEDD